jgi:competence protein ComEC
VTIAAQAAVAPILVATFDGVPVSSLPANLLAGPAAAPIMMWGLVGGVAAGLLGDAVATVLHLPTRLLVGWVAEVARWSASLPLGDIGRVEVGALGGLAALGFLGRRGPRLRRLALGLAALVVTWAALAPVVRATPAASGRELGFGARLWAHDGAAVLVVDRPDPVEVLTELRRRRIRRIDVLVAQSSSATTKVVVDTIATRVPARLVVRPSATAAGLYTVGALSVEVTGTGSRLKATVRT